MNNRKVRLSASKKEKGVILIVGTIALVMIVPVMGLAIDTSILYVTKTKLQASVDGSALAAARALNLGQTTSEQSASAKANARNWFAANFQEGYFGSFNTVVPDPVVNDSQMSVRNVTVNASTDVPTYFMRWFGFAKTNIAAVGHAQRRDVVLMLVLDRSGSMQSNGGCNPMKQAALLFLDSFAEGRDRIGMVTYSDTALLIRPTTSFKTTLTPLINAITCTGNTGIPQAMALAYNEVYSQGLPGALNVVMFMTDGLPNSTTINFIQGGVSSFRTDYSGAQYTTPPTTPAQIGSCQTSGNVALRAGGNMVSSPRRWINASNVSNFNVGAPTNGWPILFNNPRDVIAPIGVIGTGDASNSAVWGVRYFASQSSTQLYSGAYYGSGSTSSEARGCSLGLYGSGNTEAQRIQNNLLNQVDTLPTVDAYGSSLIGYRSVSTTGGGTRVALRSLITTTAGATPNSQQVNLTRQIQNISFNASDAAARRARTNPNLQAYVFACGFTPAVNHELLQRMSNDPNGDLFNVPPAYSAITNNPSEPEGVYVYAQDTSKLGPAFQALASMILRLNK